MASPLTFDLMKKTWDVWAGVFLVFAGTAVATVEDLRDPNSRIGVMVGLGIVFFGTVLTSIGFYRVSCLQDKATGEYVSFKQSP